MNIIKKKEKVYPFNYFGYAQAVYDARKEKSNRISGVFSFLTLTTFFLLGILSKEFYGIYITGKIIDSLVNLLV